MTYGEVFTRRWVVEALLDLVGYDPSCDLAGKVLVDPAINIRSVHSDRTVRTQRSA